MTTQSAPSFILEILSTGTTRLDRLLLDALRARGVSRTTLRAWFQEGRIRSQRRALQASFLLPEGSHHIEIRAQEPPPPGEARAIPSRQGAFLPVIYEDSDLLVLNKRAGIPSAPQTVEETETAVGAALAVDPHISECPGLSPLEPGLLHRLDTQTSGLLAFARHEDEFQRLRELWKSRQIRKIYRAWVEGEPECPQRIEFSLGHDAKSSKRMIALRDESDLRKIRGKALPARSEISRIHSVKNIDGHILSDIEIAIETGVMHQIRCHLSAIGHAIAEDPVYSRVHATRLTPAGSFRLHAWKLEFALASGGKLALEAPLPQDWG